ncbi:VOC family protein [Gilvimarinus xylanilyticus]|uniref:Glyoxalase/bleomycin resistance/extradiol dioxygenase family protein n=1 Tax=Gilvimarinus xylanilyticus TaxID=2944139 RepID=A0A9X2HW91_9GAMM|nr:glyoxalase/bleomycin resistance/extradiol dioxygenase family protein [Gilvimarinus xylanilyticus]MCP8899320.1 glyoxalase/bleomycin resistance/extradiol dioxygenase family protein [Gilvimarinus xylanilyticus]
MPDKIFVNFPVKSLPTSIEFFRGLGFDFDPQFTDDNATCMIVSDNIYVMLLTDSYFKTFTPKQLCNTRDQIETLVALSCASREEVDHLVERGIALGGREPRAAMDHGFMFQRTLEDLDGHTWELFYMDPEHLQKQ